MYVYVMRVISHPTSLGDSEGASSAHAEMERAFRFYYSQGNFKRTLWTVVYALSLFSLAGIYDHFVITHNYVTVMLVRYAFVIVGFLTVYMTYKMAKLRCVHKRMCVYVYMRVRVHVYTGACVYVGVCYTNSFSKQSASGVDNMHDIRHNRLPHSGVEFGGTTKILSIYFPRNIFVF